MARYCWPFNVECDDGLTTEQATAIADAMSSEHKQLLQLLVYPPHMASNTPVPSCGTSTYAPSRLTPRDAFIYNPQVRAQFRKAIEAGDTAASIQREVDAHNAAFAKRQEESKKATREFWNSYYPPSKHTSTSPTITLHGPLGDISGFLKPPVGVATPSMHTLSSGATIMYKS